MELLFAIGNLVVGVVATLIGFKVYNPFKGKNKPEKEEQWYKKFGIFFKIGGVIILIWGVISVVGSF